MERERERERERARERERSREIVWNKVIDRNNKFMREPRNTNQSEIARCRIGRMKVLSFRKFKQTKKQTATQQQNSANYETVPLARKSTAKVKPRDGGQEAQGATIRKWQRRKFRSCALSPQNVTVCDRKLEPE